MSFSPTCAWPMNPDPTPLPHDDDSALEKRLRALPCPTLPPEWREPILAKAAPRGWPWLSRPVRWGLAACWVATGVIHLTTPPAAAPLPHGVVAHPWSPPGDFESLWLARQEVQSTEPELINP